MLAIIGFLLTIGILVIIHEFGHYIFARMFNVKVITFSIGFGPKLIKWQGKHNQWCLSAILLGGYVQMLDEREGSIPDEAKSFAYNNKPAYQKLLIALAGPLFNVLFAFIACYFIGIYGVYNLKPTIVSSNPTPLVDNLNKVPVNSTIQAINGEKIDSWSNAEEAFEKIIKTNTIITLNLQVNNQFQDVKLDLNKFLNNIEDPHLEDLGLFPFKYLPVIAYIEPQSPATKANLQEGDKVLKIDDQPINSWFELSDIIKSSPSKKLAMNVSRNGKPVRLFITPDSVSDDNGQIIGKVGIMPTLDSQLIRQNSFIKKYGPFKSLSYAYTSCVNLAKNNLTMLWYMMEGKVSWHNLGGPVAIAKASQMAIHQGVKAFVDFLALISLSLAVMNLLPIPVLDGGHILLYSIEWLRGKPMDLATQQLFFRIGLIIVLGVTCLALYNDFLKLLNL